MKIIYQLIKDLDLNKDLDPKKASNHALNDYKLPEMDIERAEKLYFHNLTILNLNQMKLFVKSASTIELASLKITIREREKFFKKK